MNSLCSCRLQRLGFGLGAYLASLVFTGSAMAQPAAAPPPALVVVAPVVVSQLPTGRTFVGSSEGVRLSVVGSAVDGRVIAVHYREGDEVIHEGEQPPALVQLKTETIEQELAAAQAELTFREQAFDELVNSLPEEITQLQALYDASVEAATLAQKKYDQVSSLYRNQGAVSLEEFDQATSNLEIAIQNRTAAQADLRRLQAIGQLRISQAQSRVTAQRAEVQKLEDQLGKHTIRAPFDGVVIRQGAEVGDWVARGQMVAEVIELDPIEVRIFVPEESIVGLQRVLATDRQAGGDTESLVTFDALPDEVFVGKIHRIVPQADLRSRAFPVLIRIPNPKTDIGRKLSAGLLARVSLPVGESRERTLVPKDALVLGGAVPTVMVVSKGPEGETVRAVPVTLGAAVDELIAVDGELRAGDLVVIEGNERLRPGQAIRIQSQREVSLAPPPTSSDR